VQEPGIQILDSNHEIYNILMTSHGLIMIFFTVGRRRHHAPMDVRSPPLHGFDEAPHIAWARFRGDWRFVGRWRTGAGTDAAAHQFGPDGRDKSAQN
jgi:hypothetical protein